MKVEELIIDGFKSYATRTVIDQWDPQFNAITGLNGSGKSNILDAICFVLGISSMNTVRASTLVDLIYKRGQAGVTKASVTIVFDNTDPKNCPIGFENHSKISVTRQITVGNVSSKYLINGHKAQQTTVINLFQSCQLNINNPNFLIMQGKITKVLNMKPTEILSMVEEAAGTKTFEDRKEKAEKTMAKKEHKLQEIRTLLDEEIEPKLEKLRSDKRTFLEFQQTQSDLEETQRTINAWDYQKLSTKYKEVSSIVNDGEHHIAELESSISKFEQELDSLAEELTAVSSRRQSNALSELEGAENDLKNAFSQASTKHGIAQEELRDEQRSLKHLKQTLHQLENELASRQDVFKASEQQNTKITRQLEATKAEYKKKDDLLSTLSTGVASSGAGGFAGQLADSRSQYNNCKVAIQQNQMKLEHLQREGADEAKLHRAQREAESLQREIDVLQEKRQKLDTELHACGFDAAALKDMRGQEQRLKHEIQQKSSELQSLQRKVAQLDFQYTPPNVPGFDPRSVKGVAAQLFSLDKEHFHQANALQVCAGGRLFNVIVDNQVTASQLLEHGKLRKRVTIIPLNKIAARTVAQHTVNLAKSLVDDPSKVELALNLIGYEDEVSRAMEFIFGSSFVCSDAQTAKEVTFHPKVRTRSITLDGDVYDPEGTLSGGSRNQSSSLLVDIQAYNMLHGEVSRLKQKLQDTQQSIAQMMHTSQQTKSLQQELQVVDHQLLLARKNLESNPATVILHRRGEIKAEIERLQNDIEIETANMSKYEMEIARATKDMEEFSANKSTKLEELSREVKRLQKETARLEDQLESQSDEYQTMQVESEQLSSDISSTKQQLTDTEINIEALQNQVNLQKVEVNKLQSELTATQQRLREELESQKEINDEIAEISELIKSKKKQQHNASLALQKLHNDLANGKDVFASVSKQLNALVAEHEWLKDESLVQDILQTPHDIDQLRQRAAGLQKKFVEMNRKVDRNIMTTIDNVEKKEVALKQMVKTIEKDKLKIQETINTLNNYKKEALVKTWEKVNVDFGNIFGDLLPNAFTQLTPTNGDVTQGLEVKVKLGSVWKESLVELSGGQRSLIALSLILALLQFKPAPMYILDEVDAALDLSHTQNIGHLIKTRFKTAQFIIVSLKEGMFNNANRVFKTRFQDGTSVVSVL